MKAEWVDVKAKMPPKHSQFQFRYERFAEWWSHCDIGRSSLVDIAEAAWMDGYAVGHDDAETEAKRLPRPDLERYLEGFDAGMKMCLKLSRTLKEEEDSGRWEGRHRPQRGSGRHVDCRPY